MTWLEASGDTVTQSLTSLLHGIGTVHISENCSYSYFCEVLLFKGADSCRRFVVVDRPVCYTGGSITSMYCLKNKGGCVSVSHRNRRAGFASPRKGPELSSELTSLSRNLSPAEM